MQNWKLLEQVFTVETIMTPRADLLIWSANKSIEEIQREATKYQYETVPILEDDEIKFVLHLLEVGDLETIAHPGREISAEVSPERFRPHNLSIPNALELLTNQNEKSPFLLITFQKTVVGLVVPSDFNTLPARTYFYNLLAELEIEIASRIQKYFHNDDEKILNILNSYDDSKNMERIQEIRTALQQRKQADLEISVIHLLNLSDFAKFVQNTEELRNELGFKSKQEAKSELFMLKELRNDVMHPSNLIFSQKRALGKLSSIVERAKYLLNELNTTLSNSV